LTKGNPRQMMKLN